MLDNKLIESALQLTGKKMEDMKLGYRGEYEVEWSFCMAEFCYYLLSPEFIEKYQKYSDTFIELSAKKFGQAIYEYQKGNEQPLIYLLEKICKN